MSTSHYIITHYTVLQHTTIQYDIYRQRLQLQTSATTAAQQEQAVETAGAKDAAVMPNTCP